MTSSIISKVIALDGPAAAGKGTLAKMIADRYGFAHLDTGILYRGVAWMLLNDGESPHDEGMAVAAARIFTLDHIRGAALRTAEIGAAASVVAANPGVRAALFDFQRTFAANPPGNCAGAVLDGRDIGTVVCPDAPVKFYVTASDEVRAARRHKELVAAGKAITLEAVLADLRERDARDEARENAPLAKAEDAQLLDTTHLTIDGAFAAACRVIDDAFQHCVG